MATTIDDLKSTIKIEFDAGGNPIPPIFILAERSGEKLGVLENAADFNLTGNLSAADEFSFVVYKYYNYNKCTLWDSINNLCLIYVKEWDRWFQISVDTMESNATTKSITATSLCEAELLQINLYDIEINTEDDIARDDYVDPTVFYNSEDASISLLDRISEKIPHYSIDYVDPTLASIQRTFEFDSTSIYEALQKVAEEVSCLFIFSSGSDSSGKPARTISAYDLCDNCNSCGYRGTMTDGVCPDCGGTDITYGYGVNTNILIDADNLGNELELTVDVDGYKTCFRLKSGDDLMDAAIASCNPNGTLYLWYFDDATRASMSEELQTKLAEYDEAYSSFDEITSSDMDFSEYNALIEKYESDDLAVSELETISTFAELMEAYYDTIDFQLYLQSSYMPSLNTEGLSELSTQIEKLNDLQTTTNTVGVTVSLSNLTETTAKSYVLAYVKTLVSQAYFDIEVVSGYTYDEDNYKWKGQFKLTSVSDEDTYDTTKIIAFVFSSDYSLYVTQKIEKTINNSADDESDTLIAMFESDLSDFIKTLKKHCLDNLSSYYNMCQTVLDVLISLGSGDEDSDTYSIYQDYYSKLNAISDAIAERESEIAVITDLQESIIERRTSIQESLNIEEFLGEDLWKELSGYRREQIYENSNFISDGLDNAELFARALEFVELATDELYTAGTFQVSISTTLNNLLAIDEFKSIVDYFAVGVWIHVKIDDKLYKLRLISYSIDYDDMDNITVEFSDVTKVRHGLSDTESLLSNASQAVGDYEYVAHQAANAQANAELLDSWVNDGLDATAVMVANSLDNQSVVYDEHGILIKQWDEILEDYSEKQIKIINKGLYFTDNNWESVKTGVGDFIYYDPTTGEYTEGYGVIADTIVSNLILSKEVGVYNTNSSIQLSSEGLIITANGTNTTEENMITLRRASTDDDGNILYDSNGDVIYENLLYMTNTGELVIDGSSTTITSSALGDAFVDYLNYFNNSNFALEGIWSTDKLDGNDYYSIGYYDSVETYVPEYSWSADSLFTQCEIIDISSSEVSGLSDETQCLHLVVNSGETDYACLIQNIEVPIAGTCKFNIKLAVDDRNTEVMSKIRMYVDMVQTDGKADNSKTLGTFTLKEINGFYKYATSNFDIDEDEIGEYDVRIKFDTSTIEGVEHDNDFVTYGDFSNSGYETSESSLNDIELYSGSTTYWTLSNFSSAGYTDDGLEVTPNDYNRQGYVFSTVTQTVELAQGYYGLDIIHNAVSGVSDGDILLWKAEIGDNVIYSASSLASTSTEYESDELLYISTAGSYDLVITYIYLSDTVPVINIEYIALKRTVYNDYGTSTSYYGVSNNDFTSDILSIKKTNSSNISEISYNDEFCWEVGNGWFLGSSSYPLFTTIPSETFGDDTEEQQMLSLYYESDEQDMAYLKQTVYIPRDGYYVFKITQGQDSTIGSYDSSFSWSGTIKNADGTTDIFDAATLPSTLTQYVSSEEYLEEGYYDLIFSYWCSTNDPVVDIAKIEAYEVVYDINLYILNTEFAANAYGYLSTCTSSLTVQSNMIEASVKQILSNGEINSTTVTLDSEKVRMAWNSTTNIVQFADDDTYGTGLFIQNSDADDADTLVSLTEQGLRIYDGAITVLDGDGNDVFYTDSDGTTKFSGTFELNYDSESNAKKRLIMDKKGLLLQHLTDTSDDTSWGDMFLLDTYGSDGGFTWYDDTEDYYARIMVDPDYGQLQIWATNLYLRSTKNLQIKAAGSQTLELVADSGNIELTADNGLILASQEITVSSDRNLKENISDLDEDVSTAIINSLNPSSFNFIKDETNKTHYGLIAQDVIEVLQENNVDTENNALVCNVDGYYRLAYSGFIPLLIKTVQHQQKQINELKDMIENVKG